MLLNPWMVHFPSMLAYLITCYLGIRSEYYRFSFWTNSIKNGPCNCTLREFAFLNSQFIRTKLRTKRTMLNFGQTSYRKKIIVKMKKDSKRWCTITFIRCLTRRSSFEINLISTFITCFSDLSKTFLRYARKNFSHGRFGLMFYWEWYALRI